MLRSMCIAATLLICLMQMSSASIVTSAARCYGCIAAADSFTEDAGFTVTPATTFAHANLFTVTRSSGSFDVHADYNTADRTWNGHNHLLGLFHTVEDGAITGKGLTLTADTTETLANLWSVQTSGSPNGLTRHMLRANPGGDGEERGALEWYMPSNTGTLYTTFKIRVVTNDRSGKFYRVYYAGGAPADGYTSTGTSDSAFGLDIRYNPNEGSESTYFSPLNFNAGEWMRFESLTIGGATMQHWLDRDAGLARTGVGTLSTSNSVDIGHQVDADSRWTGGGTLANDYRYADIVHDLTQARFELANSATWVSGIQSELQVPIVSSSTEWQLAMNLGEHASLSGLCLFYISASAVSTRIGCFE